MNTVISLFRMKITGTHPAGKFPFQIDFEIHKMSLKNIILSHFSRNPIRMPPRFTRISLKFVNECILGSFLIHFARNTIKKPSGFGPRIHWNSGKMRFGPPGGPGRARPARRASLAGWPCLAGRWPAWLARLASWLARSGSQEEEFRPLAPITAGGLCGKK